MPSSRQRRRSSVLSSLLCFISSVFSPRSLLPVKRAMAQAGGDSLPEPWRYLIELPPELLFHVLSFLPPREIATRHRLVCRAWKELFQSETLWRYICERNGLSLEDRPAGKSWEWYYWSKTNVFERQEVAHGVGLLHWAGSKAIYEGEFKNGKRDGYGRFLIKGEKYDGLWLDDKKHGRGTYAWDDGDRYEGEWVAGRQEGHGAYMWSNGSKYVGQWKEDRRSGRGVYTWPQGDVYEGEFLNSHRHGFGTYIWPDGRKYEGEWRGGPRNGKGTYTWPDGSVYEGEWKDSRRHGRGVFIWADGRRFQGTWEEDIRAGQHLDPRPWDGFFRQVPQSIEEMRRTVQDYMHRLCLKSLTDLPQ